MIILSESNSLTGRLYTGGSTVRDILFFTWDFTRTAPIWELLWILSHHALFLPQNPGTEPPAVEARISGIKFQRNSLAGIYPGFWIAPEWCEWEGRDRGMYSSLFCSKLFYKTFILVLLMTPKSYYLPVLEHNKTPKTQAVHRPLLLQPAKAWQGAKERKRRVCLLRSFTATPQ